ncbi:MAG: hypothetical protein ABI772_09900 [Bacteroidota bacterium]
MPLLSITRLRIRSIWLLPKFMWYAAKASKQAVAADGIIAEKTFKDRGLVFWTCSIWEDEQKMLNYMRSGAHKKAMPYLQHWCNEARTGRTIINTKEFPSSKEMAHILMQHGKASKLLQPNENHLKQIFPEPGF